MGTIGRRGFFKAIAAATAGAALLEIDPEFLLWSPGKKTIIDLAPAPKIFQPGADAKIFADTFAHQIDAIRYQVGEQWPAEIHEQRRRAGLATIYDPSRYRLVMSGTNPNIPNAMATFDSDWKITSAFEQNQDGNIVLSRFSDEDLRSAIMNAPFGKHHKGRG